MYKVTENFLLRDVIDSDLWIDEVLKLVCEMKNKGYTVDVLFDDENINEFKTIRQNDAWFIYNGFIEEVEKIIHNTKILVEAFRGNKFYRCYASIDEPGYGFFISGNSDFKNKNIVVLDNALFKLPTTIQDVKNKINLPDLLNVEVID